MDESISVKPLPYRTRQRTFTFLLVLFLISLPFLYLYATGYRLDLQKPTTLISTGGIYLAVDRTGAEIYIDDELVRETRTFRKAFYAQHIDVGTHRVHVQKDGYHTWVKELPVSKHLVTEAQAFNLPLVPQVRTITEWQSATGTAIAFAPLLTASSTNDVHATTTIATSTLIRNPEFRALRVFFATTTPTTTTTIAVRGVAETATATNAVATTTIVTNRVRLERSGDDLFASWVGSFEDMPYYYCAEPFPPYDAGTTTPLETVVVDTDDERDADGNFVMHPMQAVSPDTACEPTIRIDRKSQEILDFDFFPGTEDIVLVALTDGIYAVEIDDRAWQNMQPVMQGQSLRMHITNGMLYVYDGSTIYQVLLSAELES